MSIITHLATQANPAVEAAIPVMQKGLSLGGAGSLITAATVILGFVKVWPIIQLQTIKAKAALRGERRDEIAALREDLDAAIKTVNEMRMEVVSVKAELLASNVRINQYDFALRLASNEIERSIPNSAVPAQIRELLAAAVPKPNPSGIRQADMDVIRRGTPHD